MSKEPNKGLQIRRNKLNKQIRKRAEIKPEQQDLICFVEYTEKIIEKINGKYRRPTSSRKGVGLQVKNRVYLPNGKYKMVNRTTFYITQRYEGVPEWANKVLLEFYEEAQQTQGFPKKKQGQTKSISESRIKPARKRCNTCENFVYAISGNKGGYKCTVTGHFTQNYKQLKHCMAPNYKRKKTEKQE